MCVSDIINTAIGAFLGFILGYLLEMIIESKKRQNSIKNVKIELMDILNTLESSKDNFKVLNNYYTPIWDTIIGTGDILSYINKSYYGKLIMIYSNILYLNKLEKLIDEKDTDFKKKMNLILEKRKAIYEELIQLNINSLK